jgi:hypothetical protein
MELMIQDIGRFGDFQAGICGLRGKADCKNGCMEGIADKCVVFNGTEFLLLCDFEKGVETGG